MSFKRSTMFRDYSTSQSAFRPNKMHKINELLFLQDQINYERVNLEFQNDNWFASLLKPYVPYLSFAIPNYEAETLNALLSTFQKPGTADSLVKLCKGLFGNDSIVVYTPQAGVVNLDVSNANILFQRGWVDSATAPNLAIVDKELQGDWIVFDDFSSLAGNSLNELIMQFIPTGWALNFNITI